MLLLSVLRLHFLEEKPYVLETLLLGLFFDAAKKWTVILPCLDSCYSNIKLLFIYYNIFLGIFKSKIYALGFFIRLTDEKSLIGSINANLTSILISPIFKYKSINIILSMNFFMIFSFDGEQRHTFLPTVKTNKLRLPLIGG